MSEIPLSSRELEIAKLTALGLASSAIGNQIGISAKTVETYRDRIRLKWGLSTAREIPAQCFQRGLMR